MPAGWSHTTAATLGAGFTALVTLPWILIGLSDWLLFDIPRWSLWAVFAGTPAVTVSALTILTLRRAVQQWRQGRVTAATSPAPCAALPRRAAVCRLAHGAATLPARQAATAAARVKRAA